MKRFLILLFITIVSFSLVSCSENGYYANGYEEGYSAGYSDGKSDTRFEMEDDFSNGYIEGYSDGYREASTDLDDYAWQLEWDAVHHVTDAGGWHPEEAWMLIEAYQNNESFYPDGSVPSHQDYLDAIDSLIQFYRYFYDHHYEDDQ